MILGAYDLDLYCKKLAIPEGKVSDGVHYYDEFPAQFIGYDRKQSYAMARSKGWKFTRDGDCLCPKCSGKKPK